MKHLLFAAYMFSVLYCYLQLNTMIDRCIDLFKTRHPSLPMDAPTGWKGIKLEVEILAISAIPVVNLLLGGFISAVDDSAISEITRSVEANHWQEIRAFEKATEELLGSDRQEPVASGD